MSELNTTAIYRGIARCTPRLSIEDEHVLAQQLPDPQARERLIAAHLYLVVAIAYRYRYTQHDLADLMQEGAIGLLRAVDRFDHQRRLAPYAAACIRSAIISYLLAARVVRLPQSAAARLQQVQRESFRLECDLGREPTIHELAVATGLTEHQVLEAYQTAYTTQSLDAETSIGTPLRTVIAHPDAPDPAHEANRRELTDLIDHILTKLSTRERRVLQMHYGLADTTPHNLTQISQELGISRQAVHDIKATALAYLRISPHARPLRALL